jgi:magnesium chelatase family protein
MAVERMGLSARAYHRILKLSRTIADLAGSEQVLVSHPTEDLQNQPRDMV